MKYLAQLGRLPDISIAELSSLFPDSKIEKITPQVAVFETAKKPNINRLGGTLKLGRLLKNTPVDFLVNLPFEGKITLGVSDFSRDNSRKKSTNEAMKIKKILTRYGKSVRILANNAAILSTATAHHNQLGEKNGHHEFLKLGREWYVSIGVQNISAYSERDQARPARDAKIGMLPPKLAQILINLCGELPKGARILDPFCGTGVVLQEASLMGYSTYGTDLSERMVKYSKKNLLWLEQNYSKKRLNNAEIKINARIEVGDATSYVWQEKIDAVACEVYLGLPMSKPPVEIKLKEQKQECKRIILGFLKNFLEQAEKNTRLALAIPAWLRPDGRYEKLGILDEIEELGYNRLNSVSRGNMLYYREGQIVAREIIVLRKR